MTAEILGNGLINTYGFNANTGTLDTLQSGVEINTLSSGCMPWRSYFLIFGSSTGRVPER